MRVLVTGSRGMLGADFIKVLTDRHELIGLDIEELDITDSNQTLKSLGEIKPEVVINCAAFTDVDGCETNIYHAFAVNETGPRNLAKACKELDIPLVHFSTDYVFDGTATVPYKESDTPNPQSIYGKSKLAGEQAIREITHKHYIIRTSWLYGENGSNFVRTMLRLSKEKDEIGVVNDQTGSPTYTGDLAKAVAELIMTPAYGTYHITNSGTCTWYEFTLEIFRQAGVNGVKVNPISTEELNRPAPRPRYSVLDNFNWRLQGFKPLRHYKEALTDYLAKEKGVL